MTRCRRIFINTRKILTLQLKKNPCIHQFKKYVPGVLVVAQQKQICLVSIRMQVQSLASLSGLRIQRCCELWCRPADTALIRPLAWKPPYATGVRLKKRQKNIYICTNTFYYKKQPHSAIPLLGVFPKEMKM